MRAHRGKFQPLLALIFNTSVELCWLDLGWLPDAHPAVLSLPLLNRTPGDVRGKTQRVKVKARRSLARYQHRQNRLYSGKISFLAIRIDLDGEKLNPKLTQHLPSLPFFLGSTSLLHSQLPCLFPQMVQGLGNGGVMASPYQLLAPHGFPCSCMDSPQAAALQDKPGVVLITSCREIPAPRWSFQGL